ncbi:hypothetical protein E2C01_044756 [Portunus trituberculatus]|uniref:Uncharacterized protein n=1 Tax=Portunus trituberculatus TaxID=210409 RepID=A0A5B7G114_PORTR|nr:hypothetical protein [Portunus trituberculatus]
MALGEGSAGRDACLLALSPRPQDGMLMPYPRAASFVLSVGRGPLSDKLCLTGHNLTQRGMMGSQ